MKKLTGILFFAIALTVVPGVFASDWLESFSDNSTYQMYVKDKLSIGLRFSYFSFTDPSQKTYDSNGDLVGGYTRGISTYDLEEKESAVPTPYLIYDFNQYVAIQLAWEYVKGRAWTLDTADPHYDGDLKLSGPSLVLRGSYPNDTLFTPFAGVGLAYLFADFKAESSWSDHGLRNMVADDTIGVILTGGVSADIYKNWKADCWLSYMGADSDARYWMRGDSHDRATWQFPASSLMFQVGVRYIF